MEFLILAGDHLYRMDYQKFIQVHRETNADITVAALPMDEKRATGFGLMKIDSEGRIVEFAEKPKGDFLRAMKVCIIAIYVCTCYYFVLREIHHLLHVHVWLIEKS